MSEINDTEEIPEVNFPMNLKIMGKYKRTEPSLMDKYKDRIHHKGSFCGGSNTYINLITCEDNIVIPSMIQSYVLHWYHMYLLHPGMGKTKAKIHQHLYWTGIRDAVRTKVTNCDTFQHTKRSNIKYGKLPAK